MSKKRTLGFKNLACKSCGEVVNNVDIDADAITCSDCVQKDLNGGYSMTESEYWEAVKSGKFQTCKSEE